MIKFLRKNQQFFIFFIFLYAAIAAFSIYFTQPFSQYENSPFHLPFLMNFHLTLLVNDRIYLLFTIVAYITITISGFYLVKIGINNLIISRRSQFSALFLISISSFSFQQELFHGAGIAAVFLLIALDRIIGSIDKWGRSYRFLDAGLLLAFGSLFYFNMIFLFPFFWVAQLLLRPISWREISYSCIGLAIPFIYLFAGSYVFDKSIPDTITHLMEWIMLRKAISLGWPLLTGIGIYSVTLILGSLFAMKKFAATKIQSRKLYQLFFFLFLNLILIALLVPSTGIEILYLLAIPSSVLLSIYFTDCRTSFLNDMLFLLLLTAPIMINIL